MWRDFAMIPVDIVRGRKEIVFTMIYSYLFISLHSASYGGALGLASSPVLRIVKRLCPLDSA